MPRKTETAHFRVTPQIKAALALRAQITGQAMQDVARAALVEHLAEELNYLASENGYPPLMEVKQQSAPSPVGELA